MKDISCWMEEDRVMANWGVVWSVSSVSKCIEVSVLVRLALLGTPLLL